MQESYFRFVHMFQKTYPRGVKVRLEYEYTNSSASTMGANMCVYIGMVVILNTRVRICINIEYVYTYSSASAMCVNMCV